MARRCGFSSEHHVAVARHHGDENADRTAADDKRILTGLQADSPLRQATATVR